MDEAEAVAQESLPLGQAIEMRNYSIDFQLPAVLCYRTSKVTPILTKPGLIEVVNRMLSRQTFLVKPDNTVLENWKLVDQRGEVININTWNALGYVGATVMVAFDRAYMNGEHRNSSWEISEPRHLVDLQNNGIKLLKKDFPELHSGWRVVHIEFRYPGYDQWASTPRETYLVPADIELIMLARALANTDTISIGAIDKSTSKGFEMGVYKYYHDPAIVVGDIGDEMSINFDIWVS